MTEFKVVTLSNLDTDSFEVDTTTKKIKCKTQSVATDNFISKDKLKECLIKITNQANQVQFYAFDPDGIKKLFPEL